MVRVRSDMTQVEGSLAQFISGVIQERNLSQRGFASMARVSHITVSRIMRGEIPDPETLNRIATYLNEPREKLYRLAGYLEPEPTLTQGMALAIHLFSLLPEDSQMRMLDFLKMEAERVQKQKDNAA